jgi:hypothetical protein
MSDIDLQKIHDLLVDVAHKAGKMIMSATPHTLGGDTKKNCMSDIFCFRVIFQFLISCLLLEPQLIPPSC